jgi:hypothetical protein
MNTYTPCKVGNSGKMVHAGIRKEIMATDGHGRTWVRRVEYRQLCTVTNTHDVNSHPVARETTGKVNCKNCLRIMEEEAAKN